MRQHQTSGPLTSYWPSCTFISKNPGRARSLDLCWPRLWLQLLENATAVPASRERLSPPQFCPFAKSAMLTLGFSWILLGKCLMGRQRKIWSLAGEKMSNSEQPRLVNATKRNKSPCWLLSLGTLKWWSWITMSPNTAGASQDSESAGKEKKEEKKKWQGGAKQRRREPNERGRDRQASLKSKGGAEEELQRSKPNLRLRVLMSFLSPRGNPWPVPSGWQALPQKLKEDTLTGPSLPGQVTSVVMDCLSLRYVCLIWGQMLVLKLWWFQWRGRSLDNRSSFDD